MESFVDDFSQTPTPVGYCIYAGRENSLCKVVFVLMRGEQTEFANKSIADGKGKAQHAPVQAYRAHTHTPLRMHDK